MEVCLHGLDHSFAFDLTIYLFAVDLTSQLHITDHKSGQTNA